MAIEEKQYLDPDGLKEVINQTDARYATKDLATTSASGLMSSSDKTKLNNIESGANKTVIDSALSSTSTNPVQNKLINAVLIEIDSAIDEITENVSNLDTNKVDKISGKGLSTEDYTTAEKEKLAGIEEGANKTVVDSAWSATSENPLQNKVIYGMFDQLVSEFGDEISKLQEADANKANTSDLTAHTTDSTIHFTAAERTKLAGIATGANKTTVDSSMSTTSTNPVQNKVVQSAIQSVTDELSDHTSNSDIHFTAAERTKLAGVATGANKYTHPTSGVTAGTYKSVTVDTQGHVTSGTNPTTLAGYGITDAEAKGTVNTHNSSTSAHSDIRLLISDLTTQVTNFLDVDDTTKDQLSEVIALIEANADSIESITSGKVNVSDIINNLTTNVSNKPLSAAQGVVIKELIDDLQSAITNSVADWNQNDETASDYIKNRTHWVEEGILTELLPETTVALSNGEGGITDDIGLEVGKEYIVMYNSVEYTCVAQLFEHEGITAGVAIGQCSIFGGTDSGEPFIILDTDDSMMENSGGYYTIIVDTNCATSATFSVKVNGTKIHHLDPKFIKDMYYTEKWSGKVLAETTYGSDVITVDAECGVIKLLQKLNIVEGGIYTVNWNGTEYNCMASSYSIASGGVGIGNSTIIGGSNTEEPFFIITLPPLSSPFEGISSVIYILDGSTSVTVSINGSHNVIHKIDDKYLSDSFGNYIKDLSISGRKITYTKGDDSTGSISISDADTKYTAGSSNKTDTKLLLVGAKTATSYTTTYSNSNVYIEADNTLHSSAGFVGNLTGNVTGDLTGNAGTATYATKAKQDENGIDIDRAYCCMIPFGTAIGESVDLNTPEFMAVGNYYCSKNTTVATLSNCPTSSAFMMQVYSPLSTTIDNETTKTWIYRLRRMLVYTGQEYVQYCYVGDTAGTWTYGPWKKVVKSGDDLTTVYNVTFTASGWTGSAAPYSQTVTVSGITANDEPELVKTLDYGATANTANAYNKAYGILSSGVGQTANNSVTFQVYKKPATDITVGLKCINK